jgi:hypothetical protein
MLNAMLCSSKSGIRTRLAVLLFSRAEFYLPLMTCQATTCVQESWMLPGT